LLGGRLGEEGAYALEELEAFDLGNGYRALDEIPFQADINEDMAEV
jgi:hypothetical protein